MRFSPAGDPGTPDARSATRYLVWLAGRHPVIFGAGLALGVIWMLAQALVPAVLGRAVEAGLAQRDPDALVRWSLALLGLGLVQAVAGILRHRCAVHNWLGAAYRTVQVTVDATNRLGAALPRRVAAGEVVSIGTADIEHIGSAIDITARGAGSVVVLGVPLLMALVALLIRPLHRQQAAYRDSTGRLTARAADIVSGLRVLRGVGGEPVLSERYRQRSQALRADGLRVARVESLLQAAQILLPGVFVVLVTWLGARFALRGEISAGELVSFYGYTAFLVSPLRNLTEAADKLTRGHVAARRVVRLLRLAPEFTDPATPVPVPAGPGELADVRSGLVLRPGRLTALAAATPQDATEIADRLGRYADGDVTLHGVPLRDVALATVRERILVADNDAQLFSGVLRTELDPHDRAEPGAVAAALAAASATDIVEALPGGLDGEVAERGREFSGGQRQRLRLARALVADPETLILVEPTSAVDAHTEARIAERLGPARRGRTTLVCTTSPLVLGHADHVVFVEDGKVVAEGRHEELLAGEPRYAATVSREEDR